MKKSKGFGAIPVVIAIVIITVVAVAGVLVYRHNHKTINSSTSNTNSSSNKGQAQATDPYAGWKTYCDDTVKVCIKYPSDWTPVVNFPGAFENSSNTGYVSLTGSTIKDEGQDSVYIADIEDLSSSATGLKAVGYYAGDNKPVYSVYDASYVSGNQLKVGTTQQITNANYRFNGKYGSASLVATPGATGYAAITTAEQAKAWFASPEGKISLQILQSFYYKQ